jgi:hypothetical protein
MRDPARIPVMLVAIGELWAKNPDWRLGQLMVNTVRPDLGRSLFYIEDDVLLQRIAALDVRVAGVAGREQDDAGEQDDQPDQQTGGREGGEVDRHQDEDDSEDTE